ncbi:MAG: hydroxyacid dehydrogenase [Bacteroidia bacterium]|nr:hydroxyacid dehydrogenase [Bacteroidia bacterium]
MNILFLDSVHSFLMNSLFDKGHNCIEGYSWSHEYAAAHLQGIGGIVIRSRFRIDRNFLDAAPDLTFIARAGAGMENIDTVYARQKKITCINAPEGNRDAVGEHAVGMILSLFNNLCRSGMEVRAGKWIREGNRGHELMGKTAGIIGFGNTGHALARKLSGFDCRILAYDKYKTGFSSGIAAEAGLDKIFREADILSLHVPLTQHTEYMVNRNFLSNFRKPVVIVNTSRGKCVHTEDLVDAMKTGKVTGVCLDVSEYEDISFESFGTGTGKVPDAWQYLLECSNAVLTPHIAGWTVESHEKISRILYEKIISFLNET